MINVVLLSDYVNVFNLSFCLELVNNREVNFKFYVTKRFDNERAQNGLNDMNTKYDFVYRLYDDSLDYSQFANDINNCDILIVGAVGNYKNIIKDRMKLNKYTFLFSERLFKQKLSIKVLFKNLLRFFRHVNVYPNKNLYLLSVGYYSSIDYNKIMSFKNKSFKWMYFPRVLEIDIDKLLCSKANKEYLDILWVGRMLSWKHPEYVIMLVKKLTDNNYKIRAKLIGCGPELLKLKALTKHYGLDNSISFLEGIPNDDVRKTMLNSDIYLFTSDRGEGWGAVLNEAMNSGLAVVASSEAGSSRYLVKDGENGLLYYNNNFDNLYHNVIKLILDEELRKSVSLNAYYTILSNWNAKEAANRLIELYNGLRNGNDNVFASGLLSKA